MNERRTQDEETENHQNTANKWATVNQQQRDNCIIRIRSLLTWICCSTSGDFSMSWKFRITSLKRIFSLLSSLSSSSNVVINVPQIHRICRISNINHSVSSAVGIIIFSGLLIYNEIDFCINFTTANQLSSFNAWKLKEKFGENVNVPILEFPYFSAFVEYYFLTLLELSHSSKTQKRFNLIITSR